MKHFAISIAVICIYCMTCFGQKNDAVRTASSEEVIAIVLGEQITTKDKDRLNGIIFGRLLEKYSKDNSIEPTDSELDVFVRQTEEKKKQHQIQFENDRKRLLKELKSPFLGDRERQEKQLQLETIENILRSIRQIREKTKGLEAQMHPMKRKMARQFVQSWKINKSLYMKYGGRVIFQQAGVEPLDAYRRFLQEEENKGSFHIIKKELEAPFWNYFTNDRMHAFYTEEDGAKFINTPWWMMEEQEQMVTIKEQKQRLDTLSTEAKKESSGAATVSEDRLAQLRELGTRASKGKRDAIDEIRKIADELYANIDYHKEKVRTRSNLMLMKAAFEPIAIAVGNGSQKALDILFYANHSSRLKSFVPHAMGTAAAMGNKQALEALLNHDRYDWLLSSAVFALQGAAEKGIPEAVDFLIEVVENDSAHALWHGATQGLVKAAREGNERAHQALDKYAAYKEARKRERSKGTGLNEADRSK